MTKPFSAGDEIGYLDDQIACENCIENEETVNDTDQARLDTADMAEGEDWGDGPAQAGPAPTFPEKPDNPHEAPLSVNFSPDRAPQVTVRARGVQEWRALLEEVQSSGVLAVIGEAWASLKGQAAVGAGLGPVTPVASGPPAPPPGVPGTTPAARQNAGAPPAAPPAPQGQWGGNGGNRGPKPRPNWPQVYKIDVPFQSKDQFKAYREQYKDAFRGKVAWAGGGDYWVEGSVVQFFGQWHPVPA